MRKQFKKDLLAGRGQVRLLRTPSSKSYKGSRREYAPKTAPLLSIAKRLPQTRRTICLDIRNFERQDSTVENAR